MKKALVLLAVLVVAVSFFGITACRPPVPNPEPTALPTAFPTPSGVVMLVDNMEDGDNRINSGSSEFTGGYWFTYDDLAAPNNGDSRVWPMSDTARIKYSYPALDTFAMTDPKVNGSSYCARMSGTVTTTFAYGFVGMGFDFNDNGTTVPKVGINLVTLGYTKLHFLAKNGPSVTGSKAYKVKLVSGANLFTDACDVPVKSITVTDTWQAFDLTLSSFAQEGWCATTGCGCFPTADFLASVIGFQFQTSTQPTAADLKIDDIYLVK